MPCYDPGPTEVEMLQRYWDKLKHNSPLAEWMCTLFKEMPVLCEMYLPDEAMVWWIEHQERDKKRESK